MKRAPKLTEAKLQKAIRILNGWSGKLTWERFLIHLEAELNHRYSKVAMHDHSEIITAWEQAKKRCRGHSGDVGYGDIGIQQVISKNSVLAAEALSLKARLQGYDEQFRRWAHNAASHGMSLEQLNRPLPSEIQVQDRRR